MASGDHFLRTELIVPRPIEETFAFFSAAENLQRITPAELNIKIKTPLPIQMAVGTHIDYSLGLFGIPFSWTTLVTQWEPGKRFVDEQLRGPYATWRHTHVFEQTDHGTRVSDEVLYRLPLYPLGEIALPLVRRQLNRIFRYRTLQLQTILGAVEG